ncbi:MAG: 23S rRNA (guanosine(2251)-2'-O)-methyltransferase RlmB, partial [Alphaproteobacteria bacterium RIFOXYD12_FULL_60_8]
MIKRKPNRRPDAPSRSFRPSGGGGGAVWLYGRHPVEAALRNPERAILDLHLTPEAHKSLDIPLPVAPRIVTRADLDALLPSGAVHQGFAVRVGALEGPEVGDLPGLAEGLERAVVVVLDQVSDPHNVGAVLRSAAAFGALAVVVQDRHSPEETGTLAKAASGALEVVPLVRAVNLSRALEDLKSAGFWTVGLDGHADLNIGEADLPERAVLVLGAEGRGLRRLTAEACDLTVRL